MTHLIIGIVGVVGDVRMDSLDRAPSMQAYIPMSRIPSIARLVARTSHPSDCLLCQLGRTYCHPDRRGGAAPRFVAQNLAAGRGTRAPAASCSIARVAHAGRTADSSSAHSARLAQPFAT